MTALSTPVPAGGPATTRSGRAQAAATGSYAALSQAVRDAGLLTRTRGFYVRLLVLLGAALVGLVVGSVLLGHSWFQLLVAAGLGVVLTQVAFVAHEASHRQVLTSGRANDRLGRALANGVVGISHTWWMSKHSRHHANPNQVGKDPDISPDTVVFRAEDAAQVRGPLRHLTKVQGWAFFPLLLLEGLNLHVVSIRSLWAAERSRSRTFELALLAGRLALYLALVLWLLPVGMAFAFLGVQLAVFGVYMGASFAPNHKGMPIVPEGSRLDFLSKQVLTSRNIRGGAGIRSLMGGLNYQVEHHLFPSMPRPHLKRAAEIVKAHCAEHGVPYTETGLVESYRIVVRYLNRVGLAARNPFECPMVQSYRPV
ncbi:fatty acid desaturase family protein [Cellulomonas marina]|uniref:Fatty acid desaturase n=1 Tax=Cellulomonas marina TaxID=988821 RepID=A0A1I0ZB93_9CELL|nr:acyl-CoA desaturase [Cellulomonas marina]GIG30623.1 fatty acid desaturase [Cellulomonas marina]SFB22914.1 Fatty acid desaturase [Cellulomonas marina]